MPLLKRIFFVACLLLISQTGFGSTPDFSEALESYENKFGSFHPTDTFCESGTSLRKAPLTAPTKDFERIVRENNKSVMTTVWSCSKDFFRGAWDASAGVIFDSIDCAASPIVCKEKAALAIKNAYDFVTNLSHEVRKISETIQNLSPEEARSLACEMVGSMAPSTLISVMTSGSGSSIAMRQIQQIALKLGQMRDILGLRVKVAGSALMKLPESILIKMKSFIRDGMGDYVGGLLADCFAATKDAVAKTFNPRSLGSSSCSIPSLEERLDDIPLQRERAMKTAMNAAGLNYREQVGVRKVPMTDKNGLCIALDAECKNFVETREYFYQKKNASGRLETFVLQEHTMGHLLGDSKQTSYEPPHFNLRKCHPDVGSTTLSQASISTIPVRDVCKESPVGDHFYAIPDSDLDKWKNNHQRYLPNPAWTNRCNKKCN